MSAIHNLGLVVTSPGRGLAIDRGLLQPLGAMRVGEIVGERGEHVGAIGGMRPVSVELVHRPARPGLVEALRWLAARIPQLERERP